MTCPTPPGGLACYCADDGGGPRYARPEPGQREVCDHCGIRALYDIAPRRPANAAAPAPRPVRDRIAAGSPLGLSLEPLADLEAQYRADAEVARAFRVSGAWQPGSEMSPGGGTWYADPWDVLGEVVAGWQASGGLQGRRCRLYLVRMPEHQTTRGNAYPSERGRWAIRDVETVGPAAGYGVTRLFRGEATARAAVEGAACSAQAIGHVYLGGGSRAALAADVADAVRTARNRAWHDAHKWTPRGYVLKPGCSDPSAEWAETPEAVGARAAGS